ncbi:MAG: tRNA epoxyqueuosine(34) reductase QueG [Planctomycetaceae bacterium]|nr:tRNA epoxyqueuosine(34) reductase QueG [Planctomycetaceae bacterium]
MTVASSHQSRPTAAAAIKAKARELGFELAGVAPAVTPAGLHEFVAWLERGFAGDMQYLPRREAAYYHPRHVLDGVRSVVMLAMNYNTTAREANPGCEPAADSRVDAIFNEECSSKSTASPLPIAARVARYAQGSTDYHDLLRERLDDLTRFVTEQYPGSRARGVVDTAPLLERDFARLAGLGWFGKNTMLINKRLGSWFFLAALLTDLELDYDAAHDTDHCGTCTRCLDACPTDAFVEPYVLDARRCISYLTIEHRGPIADELREGVGDWLLGCDVCQEVCPWNRKAPVTDEPAFQPRTDLSPADALELLSLTPEQFRDRVDATPLERPKRSGLLRNAAIVVGNLGNPAGIPALIHALSDEEPLIRGAAVWALGRFSQEAASRALQAHRQIEDDPTVCDELEAALTTALTEDSPTCPP